MERAEYEHILSTMTHFFQFTLKRHRAKATLQQMQLAFTRQFLFITKIASLSLK